MMLGLLTPRRLISTAVAAFVVGVVALYAGWSSLGPIGLFAAVLCTIMAAIMINTPQAAVEAAQARLRTPDVAAEPAPAPADQPASLDLERSRDVADASERSHE